MAAVEPGMQVLDVGSGRGEIVQHCVRLGAKAYGVDYASVANRLAVQRLAVAGSTDPQKTISQGDAQWLPFPDRSFDRVLMFDIVEHLFPWQLERALEEAHRVLRDEGRLIVHTAPNRWYDRYAYPLVRLYRTLTGEGSKYPPNPRAIIPANLLVHVNEQDLIRLPRALRQAGFSCQAWLASPPQDRQEGWLLAAARWILFEMPPFRWFFQRELYAVAWKRDYVGSRPFRPRWGHKRGHEQWQAGVR